jgi:hypothetical protein
MTQKSFIEFAPEVVKPYVIENTLQNGWKINLGIFYNSFCRSKLVRLPLVKTFNQTLLKVCQLRLLHSDKLLALTSNIRLEMFSI